MYDNDFLYLAAAVDGNIVCVDKVLYYNQRFFDYVIDPVLKFHESLVESLIPYVLHDANGSYYIYWPEKYSARSDIVVLKSDVSTLHPCLNEFKTLNIDVERLFEEGIDAIKEID